MIGRAKLLLTLLFAVPLAVACSSSGGAGGRVGEAGSGGAGGLGGVGGTAGDPEPPGFEEFEWRADEPDVRTERLCPEADAPDEAPDTTFIDCTMEGASFSTAPPEPKSSLVVLAYNILRGFEVDAQLDMITSGIDFRVPDVLLLSEVDRGCQRTDFRNIARDYALRMTTATP